MLTAKRRGRRPARRGSPGRRERLHHQAVEEQASWCSASRTTSSGRRHQRAVSPLTGLPGQPLDPVRAPAPRRRGRGVRADASSTSTTSSRSTTATASRAATPRSSRGRRAVDRSSRRGGDAGDFVGPHRRRRLHRDHRARSRRGTGRGDQARRSDARMPLLYDARGSRARLRARAQPPPRVRGLPAHERDDRARDVRSRDRDAPGAARRPLRELKEYGKSLPGSVVVSERRRSARSGAPRRPRQPAEARGGPPAPRKSKAA